MPEYIFYKTATELSSLLAKGELSAVELATSVLERTKSVDDKINAFISFDETDALKQAKESDERRKKGESLGPLDGIPVAIKDILAIKDQPLTCASKMLENFVAPYNATCIEKLKQTGAVIWGRLNMDEFAMGSSTENSAFHTTSNPWNLDCIPGGSSGGSAACVAAGESILSLGSDTGGSIRQPAAFCGIVGFKPTYGLISRYGLTAFASSLDQVGPMAHTVEDAALLLQGIAGYDALDSTSFKTEIPNYLEEIKNFDKKWKIGVPKEYFGDGIDPEIRQATMDAIEFYEKQGYDIVDISLPHTELAVPVYYVIATAEASSNLSRYDGIRYTHRSNLASDHVDLYFKTRGEAFGEEVKRRIILGTYVLSSGYYDAYYLRAQKIRTLIRNDFMDAFKSVDVIITPTTPSAAFKKGDKVEDPLEMYLNDIFTISVNLAGLPGISIPSGFTSSNLPIGLQIIGKPYQEAELLTVANVFNSEHDFHLKQPQI